MYSESEKISIAAIRYLAGDIFLADYLGFGVEEVSASSILRQKFKESQSLGQAWFQVLLYAQHQAVSKSLRKRSLFIQIYGDASGCSRDAGGRITAPASLPRSPGRSNTPLHDEPTEFPLIGFKGTDMFCGPYALLNLFSHQRDFSNRKLKKFWRAMGGESSGLGGLAVVANAAQVFGLNVGRNLQLVPPRRTREWLCAQTEGKFIVAQVVHCVGVDCRLKLIFDCGRETALPLDLEHLQICGITGIQEIRIVH